ASGGLLVRPHVINPTDLPANVVPAANTADQSRVPIDPSNWELITDAMSNVVAPIGTAPSAHLQGIDFAGKTGSAQTISNALKAKLGAGGKKFKDNGWFVGVEPRRDPEIVVCTLLEEGEHGYLAARTAAQVIKAYVEKRRRQPTKIAAAHAGNGKVEIGAVWSDSGGADEDRTNQAGANQAGTNHGDTNHGDTNQTDTNHAGASHKEDHLHAGRFLIDVAHKRTPLAVAAPGVH